MKMKTFSVYYERENKKHFAIKVVLEALDFKISCACAAHVINFGGPNAVLATLCRCRSSSLCYSLYDSSELTTRRRLSK